MENKTAVDPLKHRKDWLGLVKATQTDKITSPVVDSLFTGCHSHSRSTTGLDPVSIASPALHNRRHRRSYKNNKKRSPFLQTPTITIVSNCPARVQQLSSSETHSFPDQNPACKYRESTPNSPETTTTTAATITGFVTVEARKEELDPTFSGALKSTRAPNPGSGRRHPGPTCAPVMVRLPNTPRLILITLLVIVVGHVYPPALIITPACATSETSADDTSFGSHAATASNEQRRLPVGVLQSAPPDEASGSFGPVVSGPGGTLKDKLTFSTKSSSPYSANSQHSATFGKVPPFPAGGSVRNAVLPEFLQTIHNKATIDGQLVTPYEQVNEIKVFPDKSGSGNKYTFSFAVNEIEPHETAIAIELRFFTKYKFWSNPKQRVYIYHILPLRSSSPHKGKSSEQDNSGKQRYLASFVAEHIIDYLSRSQQVVNLEPSLLLSKSKSSKKQKVLIIITTDPLPDVVIDNPNLFTSRQLHQSLVRNSDQVPLSDRSILVIYIKDALNVVEPHELQVYSTVKPLVNKATESLGGTEFSRREEDDDLEQGSEEGLGVEEVMRRRRKRSTIGYTMKNPCRLVPFVANFTEIGWTKEFVIGPETFEMNLCMGECPWPNDQRYNATNHAIMQGTFSAYNTYVGRIKVPQPCCVPDKLLPLPLLYMEPSQNVILKTFRDMVAAHCGCY